jgi:putative exporter of polyketide antibiotics
VLKPLYQIINEWNKHSTESQLFRVVSGSHTKYVEIKLQELIFNFRNCIVVTLTEVSELINLIKAQSRNRLENLLTLNISRQMMSPIQSIVQMATNSQSLNRISALKNNMELIVYTAQIVYFQMQENLDRCYLDSGTYQPDLRSVVLS